jgi:Mg2+ and Co2+ transporter CorA
VSVREVASPSGSVWVDAIAPTDEEVAALEQRFGLRLENASLRAGPVMHRGPRATLVVIDMDPDHAGAIACHLDPAGRWLVSVRGQGAHAAQPCAGPVEGVGVLADEGITRLLAAADALEQRLDEALDDGRGDLDAIRRRGALLRRRALSQRDVLDRLGLHEEALRISRVVEELAVLREEIHEASADRRDDVVRRLTIVAAVFLPLTFLTGFFGQNFPWLVENIGGPWWFVALGIVLPIASVAGLLLFFRRRGWL